MWKKGTITLFGCALAMWSWVNSEGVLRLSFDQHARLESAVTPAAKIWVATDEVNALNQEECAALNAELTRKRAEKKEL